MDNVGDWLYIVFLVIAGISSMFGSKDKKSRRAAEVLGEPEIVIPEEPKPIKRRVKVAKPQPIVEEPIPERVITKHQPIKRTSKSMEESEHIDVAITQEELRKAVIYAEILNRKY